jgi:hypothetical protein
VCLSKLRHVRVGHWRPYESLSELWIVRLSLTGRRAISRTKLCTVLLGLYPGFGMHHSSDKHLACGDGTNLDYCDVMVVTVDYNMAITTLGSLYAALSCRPTPVQYGRRANSGGTDALLGPHVHQEQALGPSS